jgi:exonuclease SbcD
MKFIHLSDLHLGKRVNEFSMLEDQRYILTEIIQIIDREQPEAVLIAGDVYDKSVPSAEAVELFDDFLVNLSERVRKVFVISGNHDSPERMAFGGRLMKESGVCLAPVYHGQVLPVVMEDDFGPVYFYMLPFVKPVHVRRYFPEREISSYTEALDTAVQAMKVDTSVRNVLITHQFVTGAARCDSEELSVGGSDNVDAAVFDSFDYVALGHIHGPQQVGRETVRYCGTPLKYSFSESGHKKSVTVVELGEKGRTEVRTVPLVPLHDMREIRGNYEELTSRSFYEGTTYPQDYLQVVLTDEEDIPHVMDKLRVIYPNLMKLKYDNRRTRSGLHLQEAEAAENRSPLDLLEEFYEKQNGSPMSEEQRAFAGKMMEHIWEEDI